MDNRDLFRIYGIMIAGSEGKYDIAAQFAYDYKDSDAVVFGPGLFVNKGDVNNEIVFGMEYENEMNENIEKVKLDESEKVNE